VVYRFSPDKLLEYLRAKVTRLSKPDLIECSRTMIRNLAKEGLMEDGKDELLECMSNHLCAERRF
jgi:ribonuclease H2 subunit B